MDQELDKYKATAETLGISHRSKWLGFQQYYNHSWFIRNSDIVVVPSSDDNWGIVVNEAVLLSKSIISTKDTGSARDLLKNYKRGQYFEAGDVQGLTKVLARSMREHSSHPTHLDQISVNAQTYDPGKKMAEILSQILE